MENDLFSPRSIVSGWLSRMDDSLIDWSIGWLVGWLNRQEVECLWAWAYMCTLCRVEQSRVEHMYSMKLTLRKNMYVCPKWCGVQSGLLYTIREYPMLCLVHESSKSGESYQPPYPDSIEPSCLCDKSRYIAADILSISRLSSNPLLPTEDSSRVYVDRSFPHNHYVPTMLGASSITLNRTMGRSANTPHFFTITFISWQKEI